MNEQITSLSKVVQFQPYNGEEELWDAVMDLRMDGMRRRDVMSFVRDLASGNECEVPEGDELMEALASAVSRARRFGWGRKQIVDCARIEANASYED